MGSLIRRLAAIPVLLLALSACTANRYQKLDKFTGYGYKETQISFNRYLVSFRGVYADFNKKAALYRSAELCLDRGFRYFVIKDQQADSAFVERRRPITPSDDSFSSATDVQNTAGLEHKGDIVGYNYTVEFFKSDSEQASAVDAAEFLKREPRPGSNNIKKSVMENVDGK